MYEVTLIVPVYNAASFILNSLEQLEEWLNNSEYNKHLIIVNDGSLDNTQSLINEFIKQNKSDIQLISYPKNKGKGYAVKLGMMSAKGDYQIYMDADIPFGFDIINDILYYLDFKEFDLCIGNRKSIKSSYYVKMSFLRRAASSIFTFLISRYIVTGMSDTQCGIKGFRANATKKLFSKLSINGFAFDVEILYLAYKYEMDVKRIPVNFQGNNQSTINLPLSSTRMLVDIFYIPFRYHFNKN